MSEHDTSGQEPHLIISGERVGLGSLRRDLVPTYQRWMNTIEVRRGLQKPFIHTEENEVAWYEHMSQATDSAQFTIYDLSDLAPVGTTGLMHIDHHRGIADFGIALGERRNQGLGTEATRLALDWGFNVLSLQNIRLSVWGWNAGAIRAYEKAGFRVIGRRRNAAVSMGRRFDEVVMDAIPEDLPKSVLEHLIPEGGRPLG